MAYRFLIITSDYLVFLHWFYSKHKGLENKLYEEQLKLRRESLFGVANFYCDNLRKLGHEAYQVYSNNEFMQKAWAKEHGAKVSYPVGMRVVLKNLSRQDSYFTPLRYVNRLYRKGLCLLAGNKAWFYDIIRSQIKCYKPDILFVQDINGISKDFLREMKSYVRLLVGQHAATKLSDKEDWSCYDLIVSSFQPTIDWFRQKGISAKLNRLGFEPDVLSQISSEKNNIFDISFIGSFYKFHASRTSLLEKLCDKFENIRIWGPGVKQLSPFSPIRRRYAGQAWGYEMYQILRNSKITINHHGDIPPYANNMRLFEATGVDTLLITDWKNNLREMFEPCKEVITYNSPKECIELIQQYLRNDEERKIISNAGQKRTLREHTYLKRMEELVNDIQKFL